MVKTRSREVVLGKSLADFMRSLGVYSSSGKYTRLRNQMKRLFGCSVSMTYKDEHGEQRRPVPGRKGQFKHSRVTDAKGKGLAPVWRVGCLGRDREPAKADGPMKSQTPAAGRGDLHRRYSPHSPFFPRSRSGEAKPIP